MPSSKSVPGKRGPSAPLRIRDDLDVRAIKDLFCEVRSLWIHFGDAPQFAQSLINRYGKTFTAAICERTILSTMDAKNSYVVLSSTEVFAVASVRQETLEL